MRHILFFLQAAALLLLAACTQDELTDNGQGAPLPEPIPLQLTAAIGEAVATPATRSTTVDGQWPAEGGTVYVQISETEAGLDDATPLKYTVDANGKLTPAEGTDTYYWTKNGQRFYVRAWYPGTRDKYTTVPPNADDTWTAETNQSNETNLAKGDFLYAYQTLTYGPQTTYTLDFKHLMSKITINLVNSPYLKQYDSEKVSVTLITTTTQSVGSWYVDGAFQGSGSNLSLSEPIAGTQIASVITPFRKSDANGNYYASYEAIVIPQGITNANKGIRVKVGNAIYQCAMERPNNPDNMTSGYQYTYNVTVKEQGLTVSAGSSITWNDEEQTGTGTVTIN